MSTHNIGFYEDLSKKVLSNYHQTSSNTHLISSATNLRRIEQLFIKRWPLSYLNLTKCHPDTSKMKTASKLAPKQAAQSTN